LLALKYFLKARDRQISLQILALGLPVIASNLSRTLMNMVDVAMVGRLGPEALAATGMGSMLVWVALMMGIGLRTATQTVTARRLGQKKYKECGTAMHNGHILALLTMIPVTLLGFYFAKDFVPLFLDSPGATPLCIDYTSTAFLSVVFISIGYVFQGFFTGIEQTKVHLKVTITSNLINAYLNAGLIYGTVGIQSFFDSLGMSSLAYLWSWITFPELGVKGAAIGTTIASAWLMIHYSFYIFKRETREKFHVLSPTANLPLLKKQARLALPLGIQEMFVTIGYALFYKIIGNISIVALAASQIVITILHAAFMPGIGIGQACATLVGKFMGEEKIEKAETSIVESVRWSLWIMGSVGTVFLIVPQWILPIFTNDPEIIKQGIIFLRFGAMAEYADAIGLTMWFALSGAGNTKYGAIVETITMWGICLPASYFLGALLFQSAVVPWAAFLVHIVVFSVAVTLKVLKADWKYIEI